MKTYEYYNTLLHIYLSFFPLRQPRYGFNQYQWSKTIVIPEGLGKEYTAFVRIIIIVISTQTHTPDVCQL